MEYRHTAAFLTSSKMQKEQDAPSSTICVPEQLTNNNQKWYSEDIPVISSSALLLKTNEIFQVHREIGSIHL
jgi:hypothetical protein